MKMLWRQLSCIFHRHVSMAVVRPAPVADRTSRRCRAVHLRRTPIRFAAGWILGSSTYGTLKEELQGGVAGTRRHAVDHARGGAVAPQCERRKRVGYYPGD